MRRREFIGLLSSAAVAGPIVMFAPVAAMTAGKIARVGLLTLSSPDQAVLLPTRPSVRLRRSAKE
jgi:hypothetical protein